MRNETIQIKCEVNYIYQMMDGRGNGGETNAKNERMKERKKRCRVRIIRNLRKQHICHYEMRQVSYLSIRCLLY